MRSRAVAGADLALRSAARARVAARRAPARRARERSTFIAGARFWCCDFSAEHDDDAGRQVGDAHGRVGLVDVLAAGAAGAHGVDADVLRP